MSKATRPSPDDVLAWMAETGNTARAAAAKFGVTTRTIRNWKTKANRKPEAGKKQTGNRKPEKQGTRKARKSRKKGQRKKPTKARAAKQGIRSVDGLLSEDVAELLTAFRQLLSILAAPAPELPPLGDGASRKDRVQALKDQAFLVKNDTQAKQAAAKALDSLLGRFPDIESFDRRCHEAGDGAGGQAEQTKARVREAMRWGEDGTSDTVSASEQAAPDDHEVS